ncbi:MAG: hypothetical protein LC118_14030, partial [Dehalococcoidia bacterium]|nr:hypothetical protein [Dehalococcoidia bacterium]
MREQGRRELRHHGGHVVPIARLRHRQDLRRLVRTAEGDAPGSRFATHPDERKDENRVGGQPADTQGLATRECAALLVGSKP